MRIGILTYSCADNVGAVLQCYALKKYLEGLNHKVTVINYCPYYLTDSYGYFHNPFTYAIRNGVYRALTRMRYEIIHFKKNYKMHTSFEEFRSKYLNMGKEKFYTQNDLVNLVVSYDALVVGSDQIWRTIDHSLKIDDTFLLSFVDPNHCKKISYAASLGKIHETTAPVFNQYLSDFHGVSVREEEGKQFISNAINRSVTQVLDPTFLNHAKVYENLLRDSNLNTDVKYIFVYCLQDNEEVIKLVNKISNQRNLKVIYYFRKKLNFDNIYKRIETISPLDFLSYIKNSEMVITNSFHGTAFSIIFNKDFYCIPHTETGNRMISLLNGLDLSHRIIMKASDYDEEPIDWHSVMKSLDEEKNISIDFLNNFL